MQLNLTKKLMQATLAGSMILGSFMPLPLPQYSSANRPQVLKGIVHDGECTTFLQEIIFLNETHLLIRRNEDTNHPESQKCYLYIDVGNNGTLDYCGTLDSKSGASLSVGDFNLTSVELFSEAEAQSFQQVYGMYQELIRALQGSERR